VATKKSQRVGIWIIVFAMTFGTLGAFFLPILMNDNASKDAAEQQKLLDEYYAQIKKQAKENNLPLDGYAAAPFDAKAVTELRTEDLVAGDGAEATKDSKVTVAYFGWTPDGMIFDSSNKKDKSGQPFSFKPSEGGAIEGWITAVPGMKVGGVRRVTIPAVQAYGAQGSPPMIEANTPLTFIMKLEKVE